MTGSPVAQGTLYGVGVGPGDPELVTVKALHVVRQAHVVAVPVTQLPSAAAGHAANESYALSVVAAHLRPDHVLLRLHFPMVRDIAVRTASRRAAAEAVLEQLRAGRDVAFLTEGDPLFHSTFTYLLAHLPPDVRVEVVPGVSSISAAAAQAALPLASADQRLAVLPATFEDTATLRSTFQNFDTVVLLKVHRVLDQVIETLEELGLIDQAVLVERASHPTGRIVRQVGALRGGAVHYLSLLIVRTRRHAGED